MNDLPIALFDSGVGGFSVLSSVRRMLPCEHIIYLADNKRMPYGDKDPETIIRYVRNAALFLQNLKVKALVIACHTVSVHALEALQSEISIPVINVLQSSVSATPPCERLALLGTKRTIESGVYQSLLPAVKIFPIPCPLLASKIEEQEETEALVREYLAPLAHTRIDAALLACTHYPLAREVLQKVFGEKVLLIDPADYVASELKRRLETAGLLRNAPEGADLRFFVTSGPDLFAKKARLFLNLEVVPYFIEINAKLQ